MAIGEGRKDILSLLSHPALLNHSRLIQYMHHYEYQSVSQPEKPEKGGVLTPGQGAAASGRAHISWGLVRNWVESVARDWQD